MNIANYRVLVWKNDGSYGCRAWAHAGSRRTIKQCFDNAVAIAGKRNWRRVVAIAGDYLTGETVAEWRAS